MHTQRRKKSDQSTYIYIARVLLSGLTPPPSLPSLSSSRLTFSLSFAFAPMWGQLERAVESGTSVGIHGIAGGRFISSAGAPRRPSSLVDCQLNDHPGSGYRGKSHRFLARFYFSPGPKGSSSRLLWPSSIEARDAVAPATDARAETRGRRSSNALANAAFSNSGHSRQAEGNDAILRAHERGSQTRHDQV